LTVWEDASERGFVERRHEPGNGALVCVTALGFNFLAMHRRASASTLECSQDD
jgi:hypothetical protein